MNPETQTPDSAAPRLGQYLALAVRHRWWLLLSAGVCWAIALAGSILLPAKFRSETVILIEQQRVPAEYVAPNVTTDLQEQMQSLTQQILSRTRLARIMDSFHLYGKNPDQAATDKMIQRMRDDITIDLIKSGGRAEELSAFKVSYSAPSPKLAQAVAGQLTSLFIAENLQSQQQLSEDTTNFLDSQLLEAGAELERQEQLLGQLRSKYMGELPEQLPGNVQILTGLQSRLESETGALHQAEQQRLYLVSLIGQSKSLQPADGEDSSAAPGPATVLDDQIAKMQAELSDLMARYTPEHPDVIRLKTQIAEAEARKRQLEADGQSGMGTAPAGDMRGRTNAGISPIVQLESQLKANLLEIANRKQEVKAIENQIEQYQARLNLTPMREQQLADASRNLDQSRANYNSLLAKKQESARATDLAKRQQGMQFSVIDPPSLPQRPYWPNPLRFGLLGLAGGLAASLAGIILKEAADPRVRGEEDLRPWISKSKIVAAIPPLLTRAEEKQRSRLRTLEIFAGSVTATLIPVMTLIAYLKR